MRLHHARAQPPPAAARVGVSCQLRQPRRGEGGVVSRAVSAAPRATPTTARRLTIRRSTPWSSPCRRAFHLDLTLQALAAGKHVLVEKPAFPRMDDYAAAAAARDQAARIVLVGENDHYKPLAVTLRRLIAGGAIGEMVFAHFTTHRASPEDRRRLAQRRDDGGRRRVLRGRDPLAAPGRQPRPGDRPASVHGFRPSPAAAASAATGAPRA